MVFIHLLTGCSCCSSVTGFSSFLHFIPKKLKSFISIRSTISSSSEAWNNTKQVTQRCTLKVDSGSYWSQGKLQDKNLCLRWNKPTFSRAWVPSKTVFLSRQKSQMSMDTTEILAVKSHGNLDRSLECTCQLPNSSWYTQWDTRWSKREKLNIYLVCYQLYPLFSSPLTLFKT